MRKLSYILLAVFVFSLPWQNAVSIAGTRSFSSLLGIVVVLTTALVVYRERRVAVPPPLFFALFAFAVLQLISFWWSIRYSVSIERGQTLLQLVAMVWIVGELADGPRRFFGLMQAYLLGAVVVAFFLIQAYLSGQALESYRYAPEDFSLNGSAIMLAIGISFALILVHQREPARFLYLNIAFVPLAMFAVVLTGSRSGFIATVLALLGIVLVIGGQRALQRVVWSTAILSAFVVLFFAVSSDQQLEENVKRISFASETSSLATLTGRTTIWSAGIDSFQESPFLGKGGGTFPLAVRDELGSPRAPHNLFISVAVEGGIVGLVVIVIALLAALVPTLRVRGILRALFVILFLVVLEMAFIANVDTNKVVWFVLALLSMAPVALRGVGEGSRRNVPACPPAGDAQR